MPLMSQRAFARHRGISEMTVREYIAKGHISLDSFETDAKTKKTLLNSELADKELDLKLEPSRSAGAAARKIGLANGIGEAKTNTSPPGAVETSAETPNDDGAPTNHLLEFQKSKADTESLKARKLELDIAEREGRMLDAEEVRKTITRLVGETREKILGVASKIAPELVGIVDVIDIENKIIAELNVALENLSRLTK